MIEEKFLMDSDSFMTPYRTYYAFDLIPTYWNELSKCIGAGKLILLDMVKAEIDKGQDALADWINNQQGFFVCNHVDTEIINQYSSVIQYIAGSTFYSNAALTNWSRGDIADPWLIATAKAKGYTIITIEKPSGGLSSKQPSSNPKIPDVAKEFDVKTGDVYYMMRQLKIKI